MERRVALHNFARLAVFRDWEREMELSGSMDYLLAPLDRWEWVVVPGRDAGGYLRHVARVSGLERFHSEVEALIHEHGEAWRRAFAVALGVSQ
ncbi:MAG: hypothetical protein AAGE52_01135 [Myxococcota bacterium]